MKKTDTRVQFTKQKLKEAIIGLLQEKSIDKITVRELCDTAGLNRGTFYLHYDTPAMLLKEIEEDFLTQNRKLFESFWQKGREQNIMEALFSYIKENRDIFCILMGPHGNPYFTTDLFDGMRDGILDQWQLEFPAYQKEDLDFIYEYVFLGSTRLILNWLEDSKGLTATQFTKRVERLGHHALMAVKEF